MLSRRGEPVFSLLFVVLLAVIAMILFAACVLRIVNGLAMAHTSCSALRPLPTLMLAYVDYCFVP